MKPEVLFVAPAPELQVREWPRTRVVLRGKHKRGVVSSCFLCSNK